MVSFRRRRSTDLEPIAQAPQDGPAGSSGRRIASVDDLLDAAITLPSTAVRGQVDRLRARRPGATPEELITLLERRYLMTVTSTGGAVGAAAALPSVGTGAAVALTTSQVGTFLAASAGLALAVADVHGVAIDDVPRRRTLVLASLLGEQGSVIVAEEVGIGTLFWARSLLTRLPLTTVKSVNLALARRVAKYSATRGGALAIGRLAPFGIGAVIGWTGARAMGGTMIAGVRRAFGPPPETFSRPGPSSALVIQDTPAQPGAPRGTVVPADGRAPVRRAPTAPLDHVDVPRV